MVSPEFPRIQSVVLVKGAAGAEAAREEELYSDTAESVDSGLEITLC